MSIFQNNMFIEENENYIILDIENIIKKYVSEKNKILFTYIIHPIFYAISQKDLKFYYTFIPFKKRILKIQSNLSNPFLNDEQKRELLNVIIKIQRGIYAIKRFIYLYRYKKSKIYNLTDLCGDPIPLNNPRLSITIFQNNTRYVFLLREVMKIIISALSNSVYFFSEPISCKNPYTNIPFDKSTLYNIYFAIRFHSSLKIHELFHRYFLLDFHLYDFLIKSDEEIREEYLKSYLKNIGNHLHGEIRMIVNNMLYENKIFCMHIHKEFPEDRLLSIMRPYLELYYKTKYSLKKSYKNYLLIILRYSLLKFVKYNRLFGRKISKRENRSMKREIYYNDKHIEFQLLNGCVYEESHLSCFSDIISKLIKEIRELKKNIKLRYSVIYPEDSEYETESDSEYESDNDNRILVSLEREPTPVLEDDSNSDSDTNSYNYSDNESID